MENMSSDSTNPTSSATVFSVDHFTSSPTKNIKTEEQTTFSLKFGVPLKPFPYLFRSYDFDKELKWIWIWSTWDKYFFMLLFAIILIIAGLFVLAAGLSRGAGLIVLGIILLIVGIMLLCIRHNTAKNENHRRAICNIFAKSVQAKELWEAHGGRELYGKDVFFSSNSFQGCFNVLRDGSVEVIPSAINQSAAKYILVKTFRILQKLAGGGEGE